jgi:hypothetical protein
MPAAATRTSSDADDGQDEQQTAANHDLAAAVERERAFLDLPLAAEKVDANQRSAAFLNARPTATAAVEATCGRLGAEPLGVPPTVRNGSKSSTGALNRSWTIW